MDGWLNGLFGEWLDTWLDFLDGLLSGWLKFVVGCIVLRMVGFMFGSMVVLMVGWIV